MIWVIIATFGNLVGGVGVVTLVRVAQVREKEQTQEHAPASE